MDDETAQPEKQRLRNQGEARRVANASYPFRCCAVCGLETATCLQIAHLDHNAGNNAPDNLARLCPTHHWMYDAGLYPVEAIQLLQAHWQNTQGKPDHKARMKDAGAKAVLTKKRKAAGRKAAATRLANAQAKASAKP
jgi:predicted restriction endonuclease